jgi:hypothetical protein
VRRSEILHYTASGDLINGYYDPIVEFECPVCHQDDTLFPGMERVWPET